MAIIKTTAVILSKAEMNRCTRCGADRGYITIPRCTDSGKEDCRTGNAYLLIFGALYVTSI